MREITTKRLADLGESEWFYSLGERDVDGVLVLDSWDEAIKSCSSNKWEGVLLEAANRHRENLLIRSRERFKEWNYVAQEVGKVVIPMVNSKIEFLMRDFGLPKAFANSVTWDISHFAIELEFSDILEPNFFANQAVLYKKGHFPCGWKGRFPKGTMIIY